MCFRLQFTPPFLKPDTSDLSLCSVTSVVGNSHSKHVECRNTGTVLYWCVEWGVGLAVAGESRCQHTHGFQDFKCSESCLTETIQASVLPFTLQGNIKKGSVSKFICFCEMLPLNVLNYGKFRVAKSLLEKVHCTHLDLMLNHVHQLSQLHLTIKHCFKADLLELSLCWGNCASLNQRELCFFLLSPGFGVQYWGAETKVSGFIKNT